MHLSPTPWLQEIAHCQRVSRCDSVGADADVNVHADKDANVKVHVDVDVNVMWV